MSLHKKSVAQTIRVRARDREATVGRLQMEILRLQGTPQKLTIKAVAEGAGVHPSLVHHTYPDIAEQIRALAGRSTRRRSDEKTSQLEASLEAAKLLRAQLKSMSMDLAKLASENLTLRLEVQELKARLGAQDEAASVKK